MQNNPEILIIGGGVIGVCAAYYLAKAGLGVTIIEKGQIAAGSSYGNAGLVVPSHSFPLAAPGVLSLGLKWMLDPESPFYVKPRLDPQFLSWLWRFRAYCNEDSLRRAIPLFRDMQRASLALFHDLVREEELACHFKQLGLLTLYQAQNEFEKGLHESELLQEYGIESKVLSAEAVREMVPIVRPSVVGGIHNLEDGQMAPALFVRELAKRAALLGVKIQTNTEVLEFEREGQHSITAVRTTRGDYHPQQVILAAGAWSSQLAHQLGLNLPMQPAKGYSITVKRSPNFPDIALYLGDSRVVITPMGPHLRFAGTMELAGFDMSINQRRIKAIRRAVTEYVVGLEEPEVVEIWRGMRPCAPDGLPYIGRPPALKNLIVATAHSYLGLSMGPITGKLVRQIVCEEKPEIDLSAMQVTRFS